MQGIIGLLIFFGFIFVAVLFAMLVYMKLAHCRDKPTPEQKQVTASFLAGAPSDPHGPEGQG